MSLCPVQAVRPRIVGSLRLIKEFKPTTRTAALDDDDIRAAERITGVALETEIHLNAAEQVDSGCATARGRE